MFIIGIAGGTGSGKTTVTKKIIRDLGEDQVAEIPLDSYYKDSSHLPLEQRLVQNFDHPDAFDWPLLREHISLLRKGLGVDQPIYHYATCSRLPETIRVEPRKVVIIEGILVFTCLRLREQMDIKLFVDADDDDRLMRVMARDISERGKDVHWVIERYSRTVKPMYLQFIEPSKRYADIIIPQGGHNNVAIDIISASIEKAMKEKR